MKKAKGKKQKAKGKSDKVGFAVFKFKDARSASCSLLPFAFCFLPFAFFFRETRVYLT